MSVSVSVSVNVNVSKCERTCLGVGVGVGGNVGVYAHVYGSVCVSVCLHAFVWVCTGLYWFVLVWVWVVGICVSVHDCVRMCMCPCVYTHICVHRMGVVTFGTSRVTPMALKLAGLSGRCLPEPKVHPDPFFSRPCTMPDILGANHGLGCVVART